MLTPTKTTDTCGCDEPASQPGTGGLLQPLDIHEAALCTGCAEAANQKGLGGHFTPLPADKAAQCTGCGDSPDFKGLGGKMKPLTPKDAKPFGKNISPGCSKTIGLIVYNFCGVDGAAACTDGGEWVYLFDSNKNRLRFNNGNASVIQIDTIGTELTYPEVSAEMEFINYKIKKIRLEAYHLPFPKKFIGAPMPINSKTMFTYDVQSTGRVDGFEVGLVNNLYQRLPYAIEYEHNNQVSAPLIISSQRLMGFWMPAATCYKIRFEMEQVMNPGYLMQGDSCCDKPCDLPVPPVKPTRRQRKKEIAKIAACGVLDSMNPMNIAAFGEMNRQMLRNFIGHDEANDIKSSLLTITKNSSKALGKIFKNIPVPGNLNPLPANKAAACGGCEETPNQTQHKGKFTPITAGITSEPCCERKTGRKRNRKRDYAQLVPSMALSTAETCGCQ